MRRNLHGIVIMVLLTCVASLLNGFLQPSKSVSAAASKDVTKQVIKISNKSNIVLRDAQFLMQDKGKVLTFTMTMTNNDDKDLNLIDYWIRLKSVSGKSYSVNPIASDKTKTKVSPKTTMNLTYFAVVDNATKITDLRFEMIKWDFKVKGYERKLGIFQYPSNATVNVAPNQSKVMLYDNSLIKGTVKQSVMSKMDDDAQLAFNFIVENVGYKSLNLSKAKLFIQTNDQMVYEADGGDLSKIVLQPNEKKWIPIYATIPYKSARKGMSFAMAVADETNNIMVPLGMYTLSSQLTGQLSDQQKIGGSFTYNEFDIKLASIQRSPLENSDMIVAEVQVTNRSNTSKKMPNLSGKFKINGVTVNASDTNSALLDQLTVLGPNETGSQMIYTEVPYTTDIQQVAIVLQETNPGSDSKRTLYYFSDTALSSIPASPIDEPYSIQNIGKRSTIRLVHSALFQGDKSDNFYVEVEYQNKELRSINPVAIRAYLLNEENSSIPVVLSDYKQKIFPNGTVLLSGWTSVPKKFAIDNMKFIVGQSIGTKPADNVPGSLALAKPVSFNISLKDGNITKNDFNKIGFLNYFVTLRNFYPQVHVLWNGAESYTVDGLQLKFDYDLDKFMEYESVAEKHKIIIEFVDLGAKRATYSKVFNMNELKDGEEQFTEGKNLSKTILFSDTNVINKMGMYQKYKINVYHVVNENKFLLASKDIDWYSIQN